MAVITSFTKIYIWEHLFIVCNSKKWEQHKFSSIGNYLNKSYSWKKLNEAVKKNEVRLLHAYVPSSLRKWKIQGAEQSIMWPFPIVV